MLWTNKFVGYSSLKCEEAANGASKTTAPMAKDAEFLILEALQFAFGCSTTTIISSNRMRWFIGRRISGSDPKRKLRGVKFWKDICERDTILMRSVTRTVRRVRARTDSTTSFL